LGNLQPQASSQSAKPSPKKRKWTRITRDDETGIFTDIEDLPIDKPNARFYKVWSPHAKIAMFVKYLRKNPAIDDSIRTAKILREYQNYKLFRDPNVIDVYDVGWIRCEDGSEHPFISTRFLDGENLEKWRESHNPSPQQVATIVHVCAATLHRLLTICKEEALREAKRSGNERVIPDFMHLDLKPDNVMVLREIDGNGDEANAKTLKLIDFGSAGFADEATAEGGVGYLAPERFLEMAERPSPNPTWDIFSLGGILYFLHYGNHPRSPYRTSKVEWDKWLNELDLGVSDLTTICRKCLAYDARDRYQIPSELEEDLDSWLHDRPTLHAGIIYTRRQVHQLQVNRCKKFDNIRDHSQLISKAFIGTAMSAFSLSLLSLGLTRIGYSPNFASMSTCIVFMASCLVIFGHVARVTGFCSTAKRVFWYTAAYCVGYFIYSWRVCDWKPELHGGYQTVLTSLLTIYLGLSTPEWRWWNYLGWVFLGLSPLAIEAAKQPWYPPYYPIFLGFQLGIMYLVFAASFWWESEKEASDQVVSL
jgi:serine/threonine protein kinase